MNLLLLLAIGIIIMVIAKTVKWQKVQYDELSTAAQYDELSTATLLILGFSNWDEIPYIDTSVTVESLQALKEYDEIKFFKENPEKLVEAEKVLQHKKDIKRDVEAFLDNNEFDSHLQYNRLKNQLYNVLTNAKAYRIKVNNVTSAGNISDSKELSITQYDINEFKYVELSAAALKVLGFSSWEEIPYIDTSVTVESFQAIVYYDKIKFFKENPEKLVEAEKVLQHKKDIKHDIETFLENNEFKSHSQYDRLKNQFYGVLTKLKAYIIEIDCIISSGNIVRKCAELSITQSDIDNYIYDELSTAALEVLGFSNWEVIPCIDEFVTVKSRQALEGYDEIKFFKENPEKLAEAEKYIQNKKDFVRDIEAFLENNEFEFHPQYDRLKNQFYDVLTKLKAYIIEIQYVTSVGNFMSSKELSITKYDIDKFKKDPTLLMSKTEYNQYLKEQRKEELIKKQHQYYEFVSQIIDYANDNKDSLIIKNSKEQLDSLIGLLFDRTINSIKKIKTIDSEEWDIIGGIIAQKREEVGEIVCANKRILAYYDSPDFLKIKATCEVLMNTQREFNEYIAEKVQSISKLFGTRVVRNETINNDEYNYIRPYKKTVTPFTAEVSKAVFGSAENNPIEYIVKNFYPNQNLYPVQIQKLYQLVEELQTLTEAKQIIENYKKDYQQYLGDVPAYIMENDEAGFYARLGFATIDESVLAVEYQFSYTSDGGMAHRSFSVPMTEETIANLIDVLKSKLTASASAKEQRNLMTKKLRDYIKARDKYTCCACGNSTNIEPNLLLEIDHIIPVSKGGCTVEDNLQTLCWKCNRAKSNKILPN